MQVFLNTDANIDGGHRTAEYLESTVKEALHRFGEHITRVEAHLSDAHSHAKANPDDIHCMLEARMVRLEPIVVKDHAATGHQAIHGAVTKLKRAIATAIEKHEPRRSATHADLTDLAATDEPEA